VSSEFAKQLLDHDSRVSVRSAEHSISTPGNNNLISNEIIDFDIALNSEQPSNKEVVIPVTAAVADIDVDLILDRDIIKKNELVQQFPSHIAQGELLRHLQDMSLSSSPAIASSAIAGPSLHAMYSYRTRGLIGKILSLKPLDLYLDHFF